MTRLPVTLAIMLAGVPLRAERITWFSPSPAVNETGSGLPMDGAFRFELGVFEDSFTPLPCNKDQWARHWRPAARTAYDPVVATFLSPFDVEHNSPPFTVGKPAYIWGFRGTPLAGEWILFRAASWNWPVVDYLGMNPEPPFWDAATATPVIGAINASGSPFLMKSAAVTMASPPKTTWEQWRADHLAGETLDKPGDDPDHDGVPNLLEFVFGTPPLAAGAPADTPVTLVSDHATITIPRRIDHVATLVVEVSGDLVTWNSGPAHAETVGDTVTSLVVRDLTPLGPANPRRFIRLRAALP